MIFISHTSSRQYFGQKDLHLDTRSMLFAGGGDFLGILPSLIIAPNEMAMKVIQNN